MRDDGSQIAAGHAVEFGFANLAFYGDLPGVFLRVFGIRLGGGASGAVVSAHGVAKGFMIGIPALAVYCHHVGFGAHVCDMAIRVIWIAQMLQVDGLKLLKCDGVRGGGWHAHSMGGFR